MIPMVVQSFLSPLDAKRSQQGDVSGGSGGQCPVHAHDVVFEDEAKPAEEAAAKLKAEGEAKIAQMEAEAEAKIAAIKAEAEQKRKEREAADKLANDDRLRKEAEEA